MHVAEGLALMAIRPDGDVALAGLVVDGACGLVHARMLADHRLALRDEAGVRGAGGGRDAAGERDRRGPVRGVQAGWRFCGSVESVEEEEAEHVG